MTTTYRGELKELKDRLSTLRDWATDNNVDRIRRRIRIEEAEERILEITGQLTNNNN